MSRHGSVSMSVLADIKKYQSELAKIPGMTDREAAKAATALEKRMNAANEKAAREAERAARRASHSWSVAIGTMGGQLAADLVRTVGRSLGDAVGQTLALRDSMVTLSDNTGIALDTMGALAVAAQREGESFETLASAVGRTGDQMLKADQGSARAGRVFARLGVSVRDASGQFRDVNDALPELVDRIQAIENPTERTALATQLWGSEAATLLRSLDGRPLAEWQAQAAAGVTVSEKSAQAIRDWTNAKGHFNNSLQGAINRIMEETPLLEQMAFVLNRVADGITVASIGMTEMGKIMEASGVTAADALGGGVTVLAKMAWNAGAVSDAVSNMNRKINDTLNAQRIAAFERTLDRAQGIGQFAPQAPEQTPQVEAVKAEADGLSELQRAYEQLAAIQQRQRLAQLDGLERIRAERDLEIAQIAALGLEANQLHLAEQLIEQVRDDAHRKAIEQVAERIDAAEAERERLVEIARQTARDVDQAWTEAAGSALDGLRTMADHAAGAIRGGSDESRAAARAWFSAAKILGLADVAIKTQQAIMAALAEGGPLAPALAAQRGIQGAAAAATIAAQQPRFHSGLRAMGGGASGLQGDEMPAIITRRETVIDAQTTREAGGAEGVRRALRGRRDERPILIADLADRSVMIPLARETARQSRRRTATPLGLRQDGGL